MKTINNTHLKKVISELWNKFKTVDNQNQEKINNLTQQLQEANEKLQELDNSTLKYRIVEEE